MISTIAGIRSAQIEFVPGRERCEARVSATSEISVALKTDRPATPQLTEF